jgi:two-component system cell cycle response regulator CpdR
VTGKKPIHDANPAQSEPVDSRGGVPLRIALADDDPESLELLQAILRRPDTQILTATSGAELVLLLADRGPFHLLITDIDMPWAEGIDIVRAARASRVDIPVLFVSGLARPGLASIVANLGHAKLVEKPVGAEVLRRAVAELLAEAS